MRYLSSPTLDIDSKATKRCTVCAECRTLDFQITPSEAMKPSLSLFAAFLCFALPSGAEQRFTYPADEPVFSIAFPDDWEIDDEDEQAISAAPEDELVAAELIALEADEAKAALAEAKAALKEEFEGLEIDEVQNGEVNGLGISLFNASAEVEDAGKFTMNCALFTADEGETYFMLLFIASAEGLKEHGDSLNAILQSIKAE